MDEGKLYFSPFQKGKVYFSFTFMYRAQHRGLQFGVFPIKFPGSGFYFLSPACHTAITVELQSLQGSADIRGESQILSSFNPQASCFYFALGIHQFIQQLYLECLQGARYCSRNFCYISEQNKNPCSQGAFIWQEETENEPQT